MTIPRDTSTPEGRRFWETTERIAAQARDWPDSRLAGINVSATRKGAGAMSEWTIRRTHDGPTGVVSMSGDCALTVTPDGAVAVIDRRGGTRAHVIPAAVLADHLAAMGWTVTPPERGKERGR